MGSLYKRKGSKKWWISIYDANGDRFFKPTGTEDEATAKAILVALEKAMAAEKAAARESDESGPMTLGKYGRAWLKRRQALSSASDDEGRWKKWVEPHPIAKKLLTGVTRDDVRALVAELQEKPSPKGGKLAPRTVMHVYGMLRVLFSDAQADGLVATTPCTLKARRKELPRKRDKDPLWRATAVFVRHEVEALISDDRLPEDRRVLWAILFLTGMRAGEASDRRWRDYDADAQPLGRLTVSSSFDSRKKKSKETKTGVPRDVPVHPALAALLASWKLGGWAAMLGRPPRPEDLIIPSRWGQNRRARHILRSLHRDCETLGFRTRRTHDERRTFISLGMADGGSKDLLEWVTHDPPDGDAIDQYVTPPWDALCREVARLRIRLQKGVETVQRQVAGEKKNPLSLEGLRGQDEARSTGLEPVSVAQSGEVSRASRNDGGGLEETSRATSSLAQTDCHYPSDRGGDGGGE